MYACISAHNYLIDVGLNALECMVRQHILKVLLILLAVSLATGLLSLQRTPVAVGNLSKFLGKSLTRIRSTTTSATHLGHTISPMSFKEVSISIVLLLANLAHIVKLLLIEPIQAFVSLFTGKSDVDGKYFLGKTIWITGASSGIGKALAILLSGFGANLIISSRSIDKLEEVKLECEEAHPGAKVVVIPFDAAAYSTADETVKKAYSILVSESMLPSIDVLVNNAGMSSRGSAVETTLATTESIMALNFFGTVALSKAVLPDMIAKRAGTIAVISSVQGKIGLPFRSAYSASKHAVQGYFDSLRAEIAASGIKVLVLSPGYVRTNLSLNALNADGSKYGQMDETTNAGMSPKSLAKVIARSIATGKEDVVQADLLSNVAIYLKATFPGILSMIMKKRADKGRHQAASTSCGETDANKKLI